VRVEQAYGLPVGRPVFGLWTSVFSRTDSEAPRFFRLTPSATVGLGSGFEAAGSVLFEGAERDLDGPYDRSFEVRRRDLSAKLRWSGPLGTTRFRIGAEGLLGVPLGPSERAGGTREPDGRVDPGVVGLVSTNVGKFHFPIRVHGNVGYWWSRNDGAYYYRDFPAPIAIPGGDGANNVLTAGLGFEFGLRRALLIAELTTEQFQEARASIHGRENLWQLTVGARGHLTNTIGITGAMSFDVSKDSDDTLFDPGDVYPDAQLRLGLTFGAVASRDNYEERRRADEQRRREAKHAAASGPLDPTAATAGVAPQNLDPSDASRSDTPPTRTNAEVEMQRVVRDLEARVRGLELESRMSQLERRLAQLETPGAPGASTAPRSPTPAAESSELAPSAGQLTDSAPTTAPTATATSSERASTIDTTATATPTGLTATVDTTADAKPTAKPGAPVIETRLADEAKTPPAIRLPDVAAPSITVAPEAAKEGTSLGVGTAAGLGALGGAALSTLAQPRSSSSRGSVVIVETPEGSATPAAPGAPWVQPTPPPATGTRVETHSNVDPKVVPLDQLIRQYHLSKEATEPIESAAQSTSPASDLAIPSPEESANETPDPVIDVPLETTFALPAPEERRILEGIDLKTSSPPADDATRTTLEVLAAALATEPHARISLEVFGAPGDPTSTAEEQTRSIVDYLLVAGVGPDQVVATTRGPSADGARVEIEGLAPHVAAPADGESAEAGS
jgi:hypothetical protein